MRRYFERGQPHIEEDDKGPFEGKSGHVGKKTKKSAKIKKGKKKPLPNQIRKNDDLDGDDQEEEQQDDEKFEALLREYNNASKKKKNA